MEQYAGEMMQPASRPEKLEVEHVRNPRHGKPVRCLAGRECPRQSLAGDALAYLWRGDVIRIVVIDEPELTHLGIHDEGREEQCQIDPKIGEIGRPKRRGLW